MTKKNCNEINLVRSKVRKGKFTVYKRGMPTIGCVCGMRILVVPDLKAMNRAIKNHVAKHKQADYDLIPDSMKEFLTEQILIAARKMNLPAIYNF